MWKVYRNDLNWLNRDSQVCSCGSALNCTNTSVLVVSTSFKKLQAERLAADAVLHELSSLQTMQDVDALRDYLQNQGSKIEVRCIAETVYEWRY
jgi:hypothetical protein